MCEKKVVGLKVLLFEERGRERERGKQRLMVSFIGHVLQGTLFLYGWVVARVKLCGLICIGPQIVLS